MTQFTRGTVVHHKVMGKEIVLNEVDEKGEKMIEVRMENGVPQKFYPEELETDEVVQARNRSQIEEVNRANEERAKNLDLFD
jgi:antitoxin component YwqK of YwqJK toxin-antitoxin module